MLNEAGYDALLYEDFADAMFDTLRKVHNALQTGDAETILHEDFNDEALQNYIITYLKVCLRNMLQRALANICRLSLLHG